MSSPKLKSLPDTVCRKVVAKAFSKMVIGNFRLEEQKANSFIYLPKLVRSLLVRELGLKKMYPVELPVLEERFSVNFFVFFFSLTLGNDIVVPSEKHNFELIRKL